MPGDYLDQVRALHPAKALAVAAYGESVAAYRYRTLAEKTTNELHRRTFLEMADEEQGHHVVVQDLQRNLYPDSDFVLTPEDKTLIIVGPRLLEITGDGGLDRAIELIFESERLTGRFYSALPEVLPQESLRPMLKEMADECFEHAERVRGLVSDPAAPS